MKKADPAQVRAYRIITGQQPCESIADYTLVHLKREALQCKNVEEFIALQIPRMFNNDMTEVYDGIFGKSIGKDFTKIYAFLTFQPLPASV